LAAGELAALDPLQSEMGKTGGASDDCIVEIK
jgi:hypothetical protein